MDFKVVFRDTFVSDLETLVRNIARHDSEAAARLGEKIIATAESLNFFPERFPKVRGRPGIRRFITARWFKVFYRVQPDTRTVEIETGGAHASRVPCQASRATHSKTHQPEFRTEN